MKKLAVFVVLQLCLFMTILAQKKDGVIYTLPKIIEHYFTKDTSYLTSLTNNFYPIGWSSDGKLAYIEEPADEACGCYKFKLIIQNLKTNKTFWQWNFEGNTGGDEDVKFIWNKHKKLFTKKLQIAKIIQNNFRVLNKFPLIINKKKYDVIAKVEMFESEDFGTMVKQSHIFVTDNKNKKKLIATKNHTKLDKERKVLMSWTEDAKITGYLKSPFENRIAVFYQLIQRGWEGPPNVVEYELIGVNL